MSDDTPTPATEPIRLTLRKAIPEARDRLQSRMLVWVGVPVLGYLSFSTVLWILVKSDIYYLLLDHSNSSLLRAVAVSGIFTYGAWRLRAATPLAAACGGMTCLLIIEFSQGPKGASVFHSGLAPLILLFVLTFEATRLGRQRRVNAGLEESRTGRSASQIIANLGIAALFCSPWSEYICGWVVTLGFGMFGGEVRAFGYSGRYGHMLFIRLLFLPALAALVEATADTVSSEIGQAFGGRPFLLTTLRRVEPGMDGAISLLGTSAGIVAGAIVALSGAPAMGMSYAECGVALVAGIAGLFFDSLLGATVERKGWLGNDLVNFASTAFAALLSLLAIRLAPQHF